MASKKHFVNQLAKDVNTMAPYNDAYSDFSQSMSLGAETMP